MIELMEAQGFKPRFCVWEMTLRCDLRCKHCGSYAGVERPDELAWDQMLSIADQLIEMGCEQCTLGGGEPTLYKGWETLGRRLTDGGVKVNMITNGWGWNERKLQLAHEGGLVQIAFSLDGFREAHDHIRREGSFDRVIKGIDLCVKDGIQTSAVTHINQLNYKYYPEMRDFLRDHGVTTWQLQMGNPSGAMCEHTELIIDPKELLWLIPQIAEMCADTTRGPLVDAGDNIGYYGCCERALRTDRRDRGTKIDFWTGCAAGMQVVGIESNGNVKGCLSLPSERNKQSIFIEGNLRENTLREIWERPGAFAWNRQFSPERLTSFCRTCEFGYLCRGGCSWTAFSNTGNRGDNTYCFHRVALEAGRTDLLLPLETVIEACSEYLEVESDGEDSPKSVEPALEPGK